MSALRPSAEMSAILTRLEIEDAHLPDPTLLPPEKGRAQAAAGTDRWNVDLPEMQAVRDVVVSGPGGEIACRILTPKGAPRGTILFIHGGGWAFGSLTSHERCARVLADEAQANVILFDYRLAPELPHPAGLDDCGAVLAALAAGDAPFDGLTGPIALAGDSAGANLAMGLMLSDAPRVACGLLFYGVYGTDFNSPSYVECADGPGLTRDKMRRYWDWYAADAQRGDPRVAPLAAGDDALAALPPLYLNAAEIDPLRSDTEAMFRRLSGLGRRDRFRLHPGVIHGFLQMTLALEEARQALADAGAAFREMTAPRAQRET
ncbi:alpha/beta hydrolase fold domain-containing protein [Oceaniglobus trochenteri]|uniref:alpha/beta hydrolase fold domain-containing protein n=1 Tax=Oceaniglobus trochenteri TaxID=2763260 RepID=UPI001CFFCD41|nr:alpha/beta hydrolase fold domain-containing protein [Oceaniglobus trochenteri]